METNTTCVFDVDAIKKENILAILKDVYESLQERGYNPINQIVGYLISGDPGFISSYKNARVKLKSVDRSEIVSVLLSNYLIKKWVI